MKSPEALDHEPGSEFLAGGIADAHLLGAPTRSYLLNDGEEGDEEDDGDGPDPPPPTTDQHPATEWPPDCE